MFKQYPQNTPLIHKKKKKNVIKPQPNKRGKHGKISFVSKTLN